MMMLRTISFLGVSNYDQVTLFRPPGTVVPGRPYVLLLFLYSFSTRDFRGPWADLREILPYVQFINAAPKL